MPRPTEDRAAALRLDTVTVRWQLPAEGGQVEVQHGRLTGQLRVLHDGRVAAEAAQLVFPLVASPVCPRGEHDRVTKSQSHKVTKLQSYK